MDPIESTQQPPIEMNYASAQEHVPEAERNNRTIKEGFRAIYNRSPFPHLPRILVKYGGMDDARKCSLFPAKGGVSKYFSPRMLVAQTG